MYLDHFGLARFPFTIAPDPDFLFPSEGHQEAMAHLQYALTGHGGLICLTGEVGTGKTTLCRAFLSESNDNLKTAYLFNPQLSPRELLQSLCDELGLSYTADASQKDLYAILNQALLEWYAEGRKVICVIDEAQAMPIPLLEQVRLLTNLETDQEKLMTLILVGQPELNGLLESYQLRQLNQRITARYHLKHLSLIDTQAYLKHRLARAGCDRQLFVQQASRVIWHESGGVPRLINSMADRALLGAYANGLNEVSAVIARQACAEVTGADARQLSPVASAPESLHQESPTSSNVRIPAGREVQPGELRTWRSLSWFNGLLLAFLFGIMVALLSLAFPDVKHQITSLMAMDDSRTPIVLNEAPESEPAHSGEQSNQSEQQAVHPAVVVLATQMKLSPSHCDQMPAQGVRCLWVNWSVDQLRSIQQRVAVQTKGGDWRWLATSPGRDFKNRALVLWQPPTGYQSALKPGQRSPVIAWVRATLGGDRTQQWQTIGPSSGKVSAGLNPAFYDPLLGNKVAEFQTRNGLTADRIIGPQTLLYLQQLERQSGEDSSSDTAGPDPERAN